MLQGLKSMLCSRKFWITVVGSAVVSGLSLAHLPNEVIIVVASLFGVNVGAQGIADTKTSSKDNCKK